MQVPLSTEPQFPQLLTGGWALKTIPPPQLNELPVLPSPPLLTASRCLDHRLFVTASRKPSLIEATMSYSPRPRQVWVGGNPASKDTEVSMREAGFLRSSGVPQHPGLGSVHAGGT